MKTRKVYQKGEKVMKIFGKDFNNDVEEFRKVLFNNLDYAVESMVTDIPRDEVLNESAKQILDISKYIERLREIYGLDDEAIKKVMVAIFKEWDQKQADQFNNWLNNEDEA